MNILISTCNIGIPVLMILIGILYKCNLYKKIDRTLDLIVPMVTFFTGFSERDREHLYKNTNNLASVNRKCSLIWSISGVCTLLLTIIISLILNKSDIYNTSVILLEPELLILVIVFITVEYILKRNFNKKISEQY
ncbi:TPA: hypothetical protein ACXDAZ_000527 [Clostridium botulinum]|uniref:hypothetical protein n=1 Tax=Clostridium botulinum TaxID=1491 RepID=UPI0008FC5EE8|nr:hypothetical protein [Clostridium botulinum]APC79870.1 sdpI/YhfL family protein [Clostridium botulinum]MCS4447557.1 hypothetical protein [Clostridium botulinum]MCS4459288.1 hypothetical protein [Clostridium botulinum]MCS4461797.1 hypothetical protein [Clostridium botulinum]MCS4512337.1 hypothetical protein [Clostridium botulinum]